ncbi:putative rRNA maturation factor YbeY [Leptospira inadai serovar Lyme str. 10]|uniref:Endoribonuclease YbeY n=2 Tax=Leptospira inadai serovar Lyme TaxID=293084 RepID=V6HV37_9LEPT|nr:putative rRNA maturation factor YbeY [Leptospira inadai serovar Lyme str. 10]PNV75802.1 rRNA maturation RNase YbeY [Leptospira inadai serovar Lyme]
MIDFSPDIPENLLPYWLSSDELLPRIRKLLEFSFPQTECSLSILLVDDEAIREINRVRRNKDKETDVLSFPLSFDTEPWVLPPDKSKLGFGPILSLGEIVISWDTCKVQAREIGHTEEDEFFRLLVHGFLHLIGYDHERGPIDEELMKRKEDLCLDLILEH